MFVGVLNDYQELRKTSYLSRDYRSIYTGLLVMELEFEKNCGNSLILKFWLLRSDISTCFRLESSRKQS